MKSQFVGGGQTTGFDDYLCTSLGCVAIDSRHGVSGQERKSIQAMQDFAAANPDKVNTARLNAWADKVLSSDTGGRPATTARSKPGMGGGM